MKTKTYNKKWWKYLNNKFEQLQELYGDDLTTVKIDVTKNITDPAHQIDALSGATLTSNGVENTFQYWFSDKAYGPLLDKIRKGELNNG